MKRGARSILGSLPAYAAAAVVAFVATAIVMSIWLSEDRFGGEAAAVSARVSLPADARWEQATLDDGRVVRVVERGATLELPAGSYRVVGLDGEATALADVELAAGRTADLAALLSPDDGAR